MSILFALLTIGSGLAIMAFGLLIFYAWLPLLYALIGLDTGLLLGRSLTGNVGTISIILGIVGAIALGGLSYFLEPYRRVMLGVFGGFLLGLSVSAAFGFEGWFGGFSGWVLGAICGVIGSVLVPRFFDLFVVFASAVSGASMVMLGAHHLFPGLGLFDRLSGSLLPTVLTIVLAFVGVGWQQKNIAKWAQLAVSRKG